MCKRQKKNWRLKLVSNYYNHQCTEKFESTGAPPTTFKQGNFSMKRID
jgi:hypothetical protein